MEQNKWEHDGDDILRRMQLGATVITTDTEIHEAKPDHPAIALLPVSPKRGGSTTSKKGNIIMFTFPTPMNPTQSRAIEEANANKPLAAKAGPVKTQIHAIIDAVNAVYKTP